MEQLVTIKNLEAIIERAKMEILEEAKSYTDTKVKNIEDQLAILNSSYQKDDSI